MIQQRLEQQHLLGIKLLCGSPIEAPQQVLELVLELFDRAALVLQLIEELLSLGAEKFDFAGRLQQ